MTLSLSDYQVTSKDFLYERDFALLADAPGVGKTAPAIVAGWEKHCRNGLPVLITCPAYLRRQWEWEIGRFTPEGTTVAVVDGTGPAARNAALQADADFVITGYADWSARKNGSYTYPILTERKWGALIFDEAHRLRGRNSNLTVHVQKLRSRRMARNRDTPVWCLTGTPIVNNPGDLWPLLHLWDKREFPGYWGFVNEWCHTTVTPWATEVGQLLKGKEDEFQELLSRFTMRRTLSDIPGLDTLAERHRDYCVALPASVRKTIKDAKKSYVVEHQDLSSTEFVRGGGALYVRLRQLATVPPTRQNPKLEFLRDFLEDHSGPVVIYAWYRDSAEAIAEGLTTTNRPVTLVTGETAADKRKDLVDEWSVGEDSILIATISSLKEGISLVAASTVIFVEHSELPADQEQCVARLKRRGQTELVNVHHLWALDSPDMAIKEALTDRDLGLKRALTTWLES